MPDFFLLAFGFANLWMLGFALAAGIPILIHLLTSRRQTHIPWAAMKLLQQVIERESKRVRFEQWLLLALRMLILLLLAFALAQPYWGQAANEAGTQRDPKIWIIGIDTSYSMAYRSDGLSYIQEAKEKALSIVQEGLEGDAYALIELNSPSIPIIRRPTFDKDRVLAEIRNSSVNDMGSDITEALKLAQQITEEAQRLPEMPSEVHTIFISDMGVDAWKEIVDANSDPIRQLGKISAFEILPLTEQTLANVAITALQPTSNTLLLDQPVTIRVQVDRFGQFGDEGTKVELAVNDQTLDTRACEFEEDDSAAVTFVYTPKSVGRKVVTVRLTGRDGLLADNQRSHVVDVREKLRLLCVDERPDASRLIRLGLGAGPMTEKSLDVQTCGKLEFARWNLDDWNVVIFNDPSSLSPNDVNKLTEFAEAGGSLLIGFGPSANPGQWNTTELKALLGFQLDQASEQDLWSLDPLEYQSPVTSIFAGFPDAGLVTTPVFRYWKVLELQDTVTHDLDLTTGDPFLIRHPVGEGSVASILSAPASSVQSGENGWNSIATWPSFVPLLQRLLDQLVDSQNERFTVSAGSLISGTAPGRSSSDVKLAMPSGDISTLTPDQSASRLDYKWLYARTQQAGIYTATYKDESSDTFAVNLVPNQSSLETVAARQILSVQAEGALTKDGTDEIPGSQSQTAALARTLLFGLILLLASESILAWRIGKRIG